MIKVVDILKAVFNSVLQFCNWYAVEAMRAKFNKAGYTIEELNGKIDDKIEILGLVNLFWAYIKSNTLKLFKVNRVILVTALYFKEYNYIIET